VISEIPSPVDGPYAVSVSVPGRVEFIRPVVEFIVQASLTLNVSGASDPLFEVAIAEALSNALRHGSEGVPDTTILCELALISDCFVVRVFDQGPGFILPVPQAPPDWTPAEIHSVPTGGFGLHIIQAVFKRVSVVRRSGQFGLEMALPLRSPTIRTSAQSLVVE
jgi:anti-sigma regulatory factor (Ser/Thr protein kinase)